MIRFLSLRAQRSNPVNKNWVAASCFALLAMTTFPHALHATPLVADLSQYRIEMDANFTGNRMFLFGARDTSGDVLVVVRGPAKDYIVRKKEEIGGIWINQDRMKFFGVPSFYAIAASKPLSEIEQTSLFRQLGIGHETLFSVPSDPKALSKFSEFSQAFLKHQYATRLYMEMPRALSFMGETLFKTVIEFPDNIPPGDYTAEFYLISDGQVVSMQSAPIKVSKSGLDAFLYSYAHERPALYGISAIVLALSAGWFASRAFEKL
jgi:uncharacterized protein (TIGR02186 family)